jgi:hypothetical protein
MFIKFTAEEDNDYAFDYVPLKSDNTLEEYVGCTTNGNDLVTML